MRGNSTVRAGLVALLIASAGGAQEAAPAAPAPAEPQAPPPAAPTASPEPGGQQATSEEAIKAAVQRANNPLAPVIGVNLQNYYIPRLNEMPDAAANTGLLRVVAPMWRLLPRVTLPLATMTTGNTSVTGLGDLQVFVAYLVTDPDSKLQFGIGPQYTAPTATETELGEGKHSLGGAAVMVWVHDKLMLGALLQAQGPVGGDDARPDASTLWTQIFVILQLGQGYYLRSTPVATFHFESGAFAVPLGVGVGKVIPIDRSVLNLFIEPQASFLTQGAGQPLFQMFMGVNYQFKL